MTERKAGWYWVKNKDIGDNWIAAEWFDDHLEGLMWASCGEGFEDEQCQEIGPRIPSPDEPWQCVPKLATNEMEDAGSWAGAPRYCDPADMHMVDLWDEMLAAAPSPGDNQ